MCLVQTKNKVDTIMKSVEEIASKFQGRVPLKTEGLNIPQERRKVMNEDCLELNTIKYTAFLHALFSVPMVIFETIHKELISHRLDVFRTALDGIGRKDKPSGVNIMIFLRFIRTVRSKKI